MVDSGDVRGSYFERLPQARFCDDIPAPDTLDEHRLPEPRKRVLSRFRQHAGREHHHADHDGRPSRTGARESKRRFRPLRSAVAQTIESDSTYRQAALLRILIGCGEKAIEAFQAADNALDSDFVRELERIIQRSRDELAVLEEHDPASAE